MNFGFVSTYSIRLISGKTKDRKYILQVFAFKEISIHYLEMDSLILNT